MSELEASIKELKDLQIIYNDITKKGIIGGTSQLEEFADKCLYIGKKHKELKTPAFVIYSIFKEIANKIKGLYQSLILRSNMEKV